MALRHILLWLAVLSTSQAGLAQNQPSSTPPMRLTGGVSENHMILDDPDTIRAKALDQRTEDIERFMHNPKVYRVTKVEPVQKGASVQIVIAMQITTVKVNQNGEVELGDIVEGAGDTFQVPPGILKVGDLFTMEDRQVIEVPKDHFDPLGGLAEVGKQQTPLSPVTQMLAAADEMQRVAQAFESGTATAADHFAGGLAKTLEGTLNFLAQDRGDFGKPGKPLQAILDYLTNDYNENDQGLYDEAVKAVDQFQNDPAAFFGEHLLDAAPLGELGQEAHVAKVMNAAKRVSKMERTAEEFGAFENAATAAQKEGSLAQGAEGAAQHTQAGGAINGQDAPVRQQGNVQQGNGAQQSPTDSSRGNKPLASTDKTSPAGSDGHSAPQRGQVAQNQSGQNEATHGDGQTGSNGGAPQIDDGFGQPGQNTTPGANPSEEGKWKPVAGGKIQPSPLSPAAKGLPELNPFFNLDPDLKNCFPAALAQDAAWATGEKGIVMPQPKGTSSQKVMDTLRRKYGPTAKDPLHGDVGHLAHRQGIPVPSSQQDITKALSIAKGDSRGLVFIERADGTKHVFNARYNNGQVQFWDPQLGQPGDFSNVTKTWFYRTN